MEQITIPVKIQLRFVSNKAMPDKYLTGDRPLLEASQALKNDLYTELSRTIRARLPNVKSVGLVGVPKAGSWELAAGEIQLFVRTGLEWLGIYFTIKNFQPVYEPLVEAILSVCGSELELGEIEFSAPRSSRHTKESIVAGSRFYRFSPWGLSEIVALNRPYADKERHSILRSALLFTFPAVATGLLVWFLRTDFGPKAQPVALTVTSDSNEQELQKPPESSVEVNIFLPSTFTLPEKASPDNGEREVEQKDNDTKIRIFKNGREEPNR